METYEILSIISNGRWEISFKCRETSSVSFHSLSYDALSWRAAEYGLSPSDVDTLLEIVLHEPHIEENYFTNVTNTQHDADDYVYNTDEANAQKALRARIARVKSEKIQIVDPQNLLQKIRDAHKIDIADHLARKQHVATLREQAARNRATK